VNRDSFALFNQSSGINVQSTLLFTDRKTSKLSYLEHNAEEEYDALFLWLSPWQQQLLSWCSQFFNIATLLF
jgi:hypothetical protein